MMLNYIHNLLCILFFSLNFYTIKCSLLRVLQEFPAMFAFYLLRSCSGHSGGPQTSSIQLDAVANELLYELHPAYLSTMHLAISHDKLSIVFHRYTISLTSHITVINSDSTILDDGNSLTIITFLLKGNVLDADITCAEFHCEFIIITTKHCK